MRKFWKNLKTWQKVAGTSVILAAIVAIMIVIVTAILSEPKVEIVFENETSIPGGELKKVRAGLSGVIRSNTESFAEDVVYTGIARDYTESLTGEIKTASFIVDFDAVKESYAVVVNWPSVDDGAPNLVISCPILNSKYPETPCRTEVNSSTEIVDYLPYTGSLASGAEYTVAARYDNGELYLEIQAESCGNTDILNQALSAAREWLKSVGFDPDDYTLYVPGDICASDTMLDDFPYIQSNHAKTTDANVNQFLPYYIPDGYNVYPMTDLSGNVTKIVANVPGCMEYQREPGKEQVLNYLTTHGINYPVEFEECAE